MRMKIYVNTNKEMGFRVYKLEQGSVKTPGHNSEIWDENSDVINLRAPQSKSPKFTFVI